MGKKTYKNKKYNCNKVNNKVIAITKQATKLIILFIFKNIVKNFL